ncbi:aminotransferase class IV [Opitutaceae bacterium EW11]|nr:aminotransferase class IV [Opitutaceae bacterium EW11]
MPPGYQPLVSLDGVIQDSGTARISPICEGFLFGYALFDTLKVRLGRAVFWDEHLARLRRSATALGLTLRDEPGLARRCAALIQANGLKDGSLKVVLYRDGAETRELIVTRQFAYSPETYRRGFRLITQRDARVPGRGPAHKTTNYLMSFLARESARQAGADDVLFLDPDDLALECGGSNLFAVVGGELLTPPLAAGILPGTVRGLVLAHWHPKGARECPLTRRFLEAADEVFVTNALLGVMPVTSIDGIAYPIGRSKVTRELMADYQVWEDASLA